MLFQEGDPHHATSPQCHTYWLLDPWDTNVFLKSRFELSPSVSRVPLRPQVGPFLFFGDGHTLDQPGAGGPAGLEAQGSGPSCPGWAWGLLTHGNSPFPAS